MPCNLISISKATRFAKTKFIFSEDTVEVLYEPNVVYSIGHGKRGLYVLDRAEHSYAHHAMIGNAVSIDSSVISSNRLLSQPKTHVPESVLLHARLGHPGVDLYNKIAPVIQAPSLKPNSVTLCPTCSISKGVIHKGTKSNTVF